MLLVLYIEWSVGYELLCLYKLSASVQVAFSHGVASSTSLRTYGSAKEGSGDRSNGTGLRESAADTMGDIHSLPSTSKIDWMV